MAKNKSKPKKNLQDLIELRQALYNDYPESDGTALDPIEDPEWYSPDNTEEDNILLHNSRTLSGNNRDKLTTMDGVQEALKMMRGEREVDNSKINKPPAFKHPYYQEPNNSYNEVVSNEENLNRKPTGGLMSIKSKQPSLDDLSRMLAGMGGPMPSANPNDLVPGTASLDDVQGALDGLNSDPNLSAANQKMNAMAPQNPGDLVPGEATLPDVQSRIDALLNSAPPGGGPSDIFSKISQKYAEKEPSMAPAQLPSPTSKPAAPAPLAPYDPSALNRQPSNDDDIKSIMDARKAIRDQQMSMIDAQGDPWMKALVGLGGLGADVLSKSGNNNFMNAATKAYQDPFDAKRALLMKALDTRVADQGPLVELAKARAARNATFENQNDAAARTQTNAKKLIDYKNAANPPRTFEQAKELAGMKGKGAAGGASGPKVTMKQYGGAARSIEGLKAAQSVMDLLHSGQSGKFGQNTGTIGGIKSFFGYAPDETEKMRATIAAMKLPIAVTMSAGNAPTNEMLKEVEHLLPNIDREEKSRSYAKGDAIMHKLFVDTEGPIKALELANDPQAPYFRAELEKAKANYANQKKTWMTGGHYGAGENTSTLKPLAPGKIRVKDPATGEIRDFPQTSAQDAKEAGYTILEGGQ